MNIKQLSIAYSSTFSSSSPIPSSISLRPTKTLQKLYFKDIASLVILTDPATQHVQECGPVWPSKGSTVLHSYPGQEYLGQDEGEGGGEEGGV